MKKRLALVFLLVVVAPAYWWLLIESGTPTRTFALDAAELRRLAAAIPGEAPTAVRVEHVTTIEFPGVAVVAGNGWGKVKLPVFAYQVVSPAGVLQIDATMDRATAENSPSFDDAAFARVQRGLEQASRIVFTHEHFDHLGGLTTHPKLATLAPKVLLTKAQLADPEKQKPLRLDDAVARTLSLADDFEGGRAIAPGVVLWRAAGHTPGSQLVFVRRADGEEFLFLGDVAWHRENVDRVRERARLVTALFLGEDRDAVLAQLAAIKALSLAEPKLHVVPGHDAEVIEGLIKAGHLEQHFQVDAQH